MDTKADAALVKSLRSAANYLSPDLNHKRIENGRLASIIQAEDENARFLVAAQCRQEPRHKDGNGDGNPPALSLVCPCELPRLLRRHNAIELK